MAKSSVFVRKCELFKTGVWFEGHYFGVQFMVSLEIEELFIILPTTIRFWAVPVASGARAHTWYTRLVTAAGRAARAAGSVRQLGYTTTVVGFKVIARGTIAPSVVAQQIQARLTVRVGRAIVAVNSCRVIVKQHAETKTNGCQYEKWKNIHAYEHHPGFEEKFISEEMFWPWILIIEERSLLKMYKNLDLHDLFFTLSLTKKSSIALTEWSDFFIYEIYFKFKRFQGLLRINFLIKSK
jgi:hypothetical protein